MIHSFINQYEWKYIDFPTHAKDCKKFETNYKSVTVNVLLVPHSKKEIRQAKFQNIIQSVQSR